VSRASGIDLTQFRKGDRVKVSGKEVTETREHDGKKFYDLVLWADRVEHAERSSGGAQGSQNTQPAQTPDEPWNAPQNGTHGDAGVWNSAQGVADSELPF
jgi:single-stranded DNA-binding protein